MMPKEKDLELSDKVEKSGKPSKKRKFGKEREFKDKCSRNDFNSKGRKQLPVMNDPKWYIINEGNLNDVFSLAFSNVVGLPYAVGPAGSKVTLPSVIGINYLPQVGRCSAEADAFNLITRNLYTFVRHMNSGHANYESVDLGIYLYATGSLIGFMAHLERIMAIANTFSARNRSLAITLLGACLHDTNLARVSGFLDDLRKNAANYRARLGILLTKLATLAIPTGYSWIERLIWMNSNVFKDHESSKADMYVFTPTHHWRFTATDLSTGGALHAIPLITIINFDTMLSAFEGDLNAVLEDEDMAIMSGDIRKAFTEERLYKYAYMPDDSSLQPLYVEEMLPQIHNLNTIPGVNTTWSFDAGGFIMNDYDEEYTDLDPADIAKFDNGDIYIYQLNGCIKSKYSVAMGLVTASTDPMPGVGAIDVNDFPAGWPTVGPFSNDYEPLNSYKENPGPEDVAISTRLKTVYGFYPTTASGDPVFAVKALGHGTEIVQNISIYLYEVGATSLGVSTIYTWGAFPQTVRLSYALVTAMTKFDWFPICYSLYYSGNDVITSFVTGDLDNFTNLSGDRLKTMHHCAVLAEFTVPELKFIN